MPGSTVASKGQITIPAVALISELGQASGCEYTVTFDRKAARLQDMQLVPARRRRR